MSTAATAEHGAARAGAANPVARGAAQAGAAEHGGAPAEAPGDAPVLHLSAMDLQRMQREIWPQQGERLHQEARTWLDRCANGDDDGGPVDLATLWPKWGRWLASLDGCVEKNHLGVTSFTAEFIAGTTDPNRGGRRRCDFCVRLTDGSYWRFTRVRSVATAPSRSTSQRRSPARWVARRAVLQSTLVCNGRGWRRTVSGRSTQERLSRSLTVWGSNRCGRRWRERRIGSLGTRRRRM